jgi:hypothetical protein
VASDNRQVMRVTWVNDKGGAGTAALSGGGTAVNWSAPAIALGEGTNSIVVRAYDRAGNVTARSMAVHLTAAAAAAAPAPATAPAPAPVAAAPASAPAPAPAPAQTNGIGPSIDTSKMPAPSATTYSTERVQPATLGVSATDIGSFRITCPYSHMSFDDPIVYPGQPGKAHLHTFFGNSAMGASITPANITSTGSSTCHGGTVNRTGYWVASIIDTTDGAPMAPSDSIFYYKLGYHGVKAADVKDFPAGLRFIAGDASSKTSPPQYESPFRWGCYDAGHGATKQGFVIPTCDPSLLVGLEVFLPQCWDGVNLDSPDHRSHMAYSGRNGVAGCPASHPVALPEISLNVWWSVPPGRSSANWRLSSDAYDASLPAGFSAHADWFNGWKPDVMNAWVSKCIRGNQDCHANLLGDGRELF